MKTLYINGKFLAQRTTGVQRYARNLITALDSDLIRRPVKNQIILLTPEGAPSLSLQVIEQRICGKGINSTNLWEQAVLPLSARKGALLCLSGSAPILSRNCIPTIHDAAVYLHSKAYSWQFVVWYQLLFRVVTRKAPLLLTVSANSAVELSRQLPDRKFEVVPNAAEHILTSLPDPSILTFIGASSGQYLLAVGSHNPTKNLSALIAAYVQSKLGPKLPLVIVGSANTHVFIKDGVSDGRTPGVVLVDNIPDSQLRVLYENALAFVFPSLYEGFGIPPLEAMSCGCPVVASNASSIPEICAEAAMYFDPTSVRDIAKALRVITGNSELRADLVARGRARSKYFSWKNSASALRRHLNDAGLIEDSPNPELYRT